MPGGGSGAHVPLQRDCAIGEPHPQRGVLQQPGDTAGRCVRGERWWGSCRRLAAVCGRGVLLMSASTCQLCGGLSFCVSTEQPIQASWAGPCVSSMLASLSSRMFVGGSSEPGFLTPCLTSHHCTAPHSPVYGLYPSGKPVSSPAPPLSPPLLPLKQGAVRQPDVKCRAGADVATAHG
jgi:hypothetical protein